MTDNVRKVFDLLGVEPNEKFKLGSDATNTIYYITEDLNFIGINKNVENSFDDCFKLLLTNKIGDIVKLPKEPNKKKLRDLTLNDFDKYCGKNRHCKKCPFRNVSCNSCFDDCWIYHKDLYSDKFLDQEIEVENNEI